MQTSDLGRLEKGLTYLALHYSAGCVLRLFRENQVRERRGEAAFKASADVWSLNDRLRQEMHARACEFWCEMTGLDHTYFPLSVDAVSRLFMKFRKRNEADLVAFEAEIRAALPAEQPGMFD